MFLKITFLELITVNVLKYYVNYFTFQAIKAVAEIIEKAVQILGIIGLK